MSYKLMSSLTVAAGCGRLFYGGERQQKVNFPVIGIKLK